MVAPSLTSGSMAVITLKIRQRLSGWTKVDRSALVTGKQPPADAIILFDGSNTKAWNNGKRESGYLKAGTRTKQVFKDFQLYFEFLIPLKPEPRSATLTEATAGSSRWAHTKFRLPTHLALIRIRQLGKTSRCSSPSTLGVAVCMASKLRT